jgi:hypothetical protein
MTVLFAWILLDMLEKEVDSDMKKAEVAHGKSESGDGNDRDT